MLEGAASTSYIEAEDVFQGFFYHLTQVYEHSKRKSEAIR